MSVRAFVCNRVSLRNDRRERECSICFQFDFGEVVSFHFSSISFSFYVDFVLVSFLHSKIQIGINEEDFVDFRRIQTKVLSFSVCIYFYL